MQHARKIDVIDEHPFSSQQFVVFRPLHRRADEPRRRAMRLLMRSSFRDLTTGSLNDGINDILIARAAAEVPGYCLSHLSFIEGATLAEQRGGRHEKTRSAKAALQSMMLLESLLQRIEGAVLSKTFHRCDFGLIGLDCEHQTGPDRLAVIKHRAAPTNAVLATDVGSS